jgi:hypothetical protein
LCVPQPGIYSLFYSIYLMINTGILPDGLILIFTLSTLRNVRQTRFRIAQNSVVTTRPNRQRQRMEKHLVLVSESPSLKRSMIYDRLSFLDDDRSSIPFDPRGFYSCVVLHLLFSHPRAAEKFLRENRWPLYLSTQQCSILYQLFEIFLYLYTSESIISSNLFGDDPCSVEIVV